MENRNWIPDSGVLRALGAKFSREWKGAMAFVRTVKVAELPAGTIRELQVEGKAVAVANVGGKIYAINNTCLHRRGPVGEGSRKSNVGTCPWHGWAYECT